LASDVEKYLDRIDSLKDVVESNSEKFLKNINLDKLMDEPRKYLKIYAKAFYEAHSQELLKAISIGEKHGKKLVK
jgi:hypothetical protein